MTGRRKGWRGGGEGWGGGQYGQGVSMYFIRQCRCLKKSNKQ